MFDIPSMWAEINKRLGRIKAGATPEQAAQIRENRQNIAILYGVTESIENVIPEGTSVSDPLVKASQVNVIPPVEINFQTGNTLTEALNAIALQLDWEKVNANSYIEVGIRSFKCSSCNEGSQWVIYQDRVVNPVPTSGDPFYIKDLFKFINLGSETQWSGLTISYNSSSITTTTWGDPGTSNITKVTIHY